MVLPKRSMSYQNLAYAHWTSREVAAIARCFLSGRVNDGPASADLSARLSVLYAPSKVHLLNSAHHGIELALKRFQRASPACREVIVPAYICPSVPQTVRACGLKVCWVDVQDDLNLSAAAVAQALGPDTLAVIAPHMFGCPAPIHQIESICRDAGVALIDDAAQVVGVRVNGRLLGTFGDVGVISFAQSKTIVTGVRGSGGVMLVNRAKMIDEWEQPLLQLPTSTGRPAALLDFLINDMGRRYTGGLGYRLARIFPTWFGPSRGAVPASKISNLDASIALVQLNRLNDLMQEKIRVAELYAEVLKEFPRLGFPQYAPGRYLARVMLMLPEGVNVERVRMLALQQGVETRLGYPADSEVVSFAPCASRFSNWLVGVPVRAGMDDPDVRWVCSKLSESLEHSCT